MVLNKLHGLGLPALLLIFCLMVSKAVRVIVRYFYTLAGMIHHIYVYTLMILCSPLPRIIFLRSIIVTLSREFALTDLGSLHHFLGIKVIRDAHGLFLSQPEYTKDVIDQDSMQDCKPCATPVDLLLN